MKTEDIIKVWKENPLKKFNNVYDVPKIPVVDQMVYQEVIIPRLIQAGGIPKKHLIDGKIYIGRHRCCTEATWNEKDQKFNYDHFKFGVTFDDTCNHFEDDDGRELFVPIKIKE